MENKNTNRTSTYDTNPKPTRTRDKYKHNLPCRATKIEQPTNQARNTPTPSQPPSAQTYSMFHHSLVVSVRIIIDLTQKKSLLRKQKSLLQTRH